MYSPWVVVWLLGVMFIHKIFPRRALKARSWKLGYQGEPLGFFSSPILCEITKNRHILSFETNLLSVLVDRKLIRQGEYKEHRQEGEIFMPISFDSERNRRKKRTKKGKGQQNVASFPPLGTPPSYGRICRKLLFNLSFFVLLNRLFFLALLPMWILRKTIEENGLFCLNLRPRANTPARGLWI